MLTRDQKEIHRRYYQIGGVTIQLESDLPMTDATFRPRFKYFQVDGPGEDNIIIKHHFSIPDFDDRDLEQEVYRKSPWTVYKKGDSWIYISGATLSTGERVINQFVTANSDHTRITIFNNGERWFREGNLYELTLTSSDQIFLARILGDRDGFYIHSSGANLDDKGLVFVGHSGAGKSTIVSMLKGKAEILCEDRIIIRRFSEGFRIYGTWSRRLDEETEEVAVSEVSPNSAPLRAIMFLEQAPRNRLIPLDDKKDVTRRFLACLIKSFITADWWNKMLVLTDRITKEVPCYILQFDKSGQIVDLLKQL